LTTCARHHSPPRRTSQSWSRFTICMSSRR
jgi:hypothetical protein